MRTTLIMLLATGACAANVASAGERAPGLLIRLYELDQAVRYVPELKPGQLPNHIRVVKTLDLGDDGQSFSPLVDNFLTEVDGFITIDESGEYAFRLLSDDGGRLWIDNQLVIDHDGLHGPDPKDGKIRLGPGEHTLRIRHFEAGGGERLALQWRPTGRAEDAPFVFVPAEVLTHDSTAPRETAPGKKRVIPPLRRGLPGDGTPVAGMHPAFEPMMLASAMYGVQERRCDKLEILSLPTVDPAASFVLLPPGPVPSAEITLARLVDPSHPLGPDHVTKDAADPCLDPLVAGARGHAELYRVVPEAVTADQMQGCSFRFARGLPGVVMEVDGALPSALVTRLSVERSDEFPDGRAICFLRPNDRLVFETRRVRCLSNGLRIEFTKPLDPRCGWDAESYYIEQWPFDVSRGAAPQRDGVVYPVNSASVSPDRKSVFLEIPDLRKSQLVYIRLLPPCVSEDGERPWSTEAWYTLNEIPTDRAGTVLPRPPQAPQNFLTDAEKAAGWRLLFDGRTTEGWRGYRKDRCPDGWVVKDGCIVRVGPGGDIISEGEFEDFELKLEWRISAAGNSGIFYRVDESVGWPWETGPEMQVLDNDEHYDGKNEKTSAGSNYALHAPVRDVTEPVGFFNKVHIIVDGAHVEHWLNGVRVVDYELWSDDWERRVADSKFKQWPKYGRMKRGHIVLQDHGDKVWYRNIKVRPLGK